MKKAIRIKTDHVPKARKMQTQQAGYKAPNSMLTQKCPQCEQLIPVNELERHMKIELMDPKWKEQKDRENAKKRESNLVLDNGQDVSRYIKAFANVRKDIFGGDTVDMKMKIEEQKRQAAKKANISWDGFATSINAATRKAYSAASVDDLKMQVEEEQSKSIGTFNPVDAAKEKQN